MNEEAVLKAWLKLNVLQLLPKGLLLLGIVWCLIKRNFTKPKHLTAYFNSLAVYLFHNVHFRILFHRKN